MGLRHIFSRFILLPSFAGLICISCTSSTGEQPSTDAGAALESQSSTSEQSAPQPGEGTAIPEANTATTGDTETEIAANIDQDISAAAYDAGAELAASAERLGQTALSPDDWRLVASRWQQAIDQLSRINERSAEYAQAQTDLLNYQQQLDTANQALDQLLNPIHVPLPNGVQAQRARPTLSSSSNTEDSTDQASQSIQIPIVRRLHGTPVVNVTFNHTATYEMILDTGASRTLITREMAERLNVVSTDRVMAATASSAEVAFDIGRVDSIAIDSVELRDAPVSIGDAIDIGLLGNDFLSGYDVTIRSSDNVVELTRS